MYARIAPAMRQAFSERAENCSLTPLFKLLSDAKQGMTTITPTSSPLQ
jgi:hypothetical protein